MWFSSQCSRGGLWWGTFTTYSCFFLFVLKHLAEYFCNCTTHTLNRGWLACKGIIKSFFEVPAYTKNTYLPYFNLSKYRILKEKNRRWLTLQKRDLQVYSLIGLICLLGFGNITTFQHQITTPLNSLFFFFLLEEWPWNDSTFFAMYEPLLYYAARSSSIIRTWEHPVWVLKTTFLSTSDSKQDTESSEASRILTRKTK